MEAEGWVAPIWLLPTARSPVARRMGYRAGRYDDVPGGKALRVQIAQRALPSGCRLGADDVVITTGRTESISLCLRAVCHPGDTVAIESPTGYDALLSLDVLGLRALGAGIAITPGHMFSPTTQCRSFVRPNAARWLAEAEHSIQRLGELIAALS